MRTTGRSTSPFFTVAFAAVTICIAVQSAAFCQMDASSSARTGSARAWRADLSVLAHEMPRLHPNLFVAVSSAEFETAVTELDRRLPELTENEITGELFRIACSSEPWRPGWSQRDGAFRPPIRILPSYPVYVFTTRRAEEDRLAEDRTEDCRRGRRDPRPSDIARQPNDSALETPIVSHRAATPQGGRDRRHRR